MGEIAFGNKCMTLPFLLYYNAHRAGLPLRAADDLLELVACAPDLRQRALEAFVSLGSEFLRPVFDALGEEVSFDDLHILRLHVVSQQSLDGKIGRN
jgi:ATP-dependent DNA helicase RecQ